MKKIIHIISLLAIILTAAAPLCAVEGHRTIQPYARLGLGVNYINGSAAATSVRDSGGILIPAEYKTNDIALGFSLAAGIELRQKFLFDLEYTYYDKTERKLDAVGIKNSYNTKFSSYMFNFAYKFSYYNIDLFSGLGAGVLHHSHSRILLDDVKNQFAMNLHIGAQVYKSIFAKIKYVRGFNSSAPANIIGVETGVKFNI